MYGRLDFPFLQIFRLRVLRASRGPPKKIPVPKLAGFLEKTKPTNPPNKTMPPGEENDC